MDWAHYDFDLGVPSSKFLQNRIIIGADRRERIDLLCEIRVSAHTGVGKPARKVLTSQSLSHICRVVARA
jgi:hypothetical protein